MTPSRRCAAPDTPRTTQPGLVTQPLHASPVCRSETCIIGTGGCHTFETLIGRIGDDLSRRVSRSGDRAARRTRRAAAATAGLHTAARIGHASRRPGAALRESRCCARNTGGRFGLLVTRRDVTDRRLLRICRRRQGRYRGAHEQHRYRLPHDGPPEHSASVIVLLFVIALGVKVRGAAGMTGAVDLAEIRPRGPLMFLIDGRALRLALRWWLAPHC